MGVIDVVPCTIRLLKTSAGSVDFYDFDEYGRFVAAARRIDTTAYRLGGLRPLVVSRIFASWNQLDRWLRQIETLMRAA